ncbi:MAG: fumarylacetoacetate hydrolase family protein [Deltaproteobacteria bacterium]|nr:fumarylacetoacetate hydrolase family protein [Deltaproteobacteria bacterium]
MKFYRFATGNKVRYGVAESATITELEGDGFFQYDLTDETHKLDEVTLLSPCRPSKIVAIGLNYRSHAQELGMELPDEPMLFLKPSTAVIGPGEYICYPPMSQRVDYEAELAVVIGKRAKNIKEDDAEDYIFGYTCINDVTARDLQKKDIQFTRSKCFDTFAPIGPCIETELDPGRVKVESYLNGELRQSGNTIDLVFPVDRLVSFISQVMTLLPGDVIATGTPFGVGPMAVGDTIEVVVEGIGRLKNQVAS